MIAAGLAAAVLCLVMVLPYLPGPFDASAEALSFMVQVAGFASLLLVPVGVAWLANPGRARLWHRLALSLTGLVVLVATIAAAALDHLAMGIALGAAAAVVLWTASRPTSVGAGAPSTRPGSLPHHLVVIPLVLVGFRAVALAPVADWSRDRVIRHSRHLISEIETFRQRRGHYPTSLHFLNPDVPTGAVGIERFHYEPSGEAYHLFFTRQHIELDAREVVMFNPRDEHRFASHELDLLQYDGEQLDLRRGDRRRTRLAQDHWISMLFD